MDTTIKRAINCIDEILKSSIYPYLKLIETKQLLNQLLLSDLSRNKLYPFFCRQLSRLMKYNDTLSNDFWIALKHDLLCILKEENGGQQQGNSWKRFSERMEFERKVEERALQFKDLFGERKTFQQLFLKHEGFLRKYLQKCIFFHSNVQVRGLVENIDNLLCNVYGLSETTLTSERRKCIQKELNCIKIPFDCSSRVLNKLDSHFFKNDKVYKRNSNDLSNFLPSIKQIEMDTENISEKITDVLVCNRWIVILGDPGSAKTTVLQWLTFLFAKAADCGNERVKMNESDECRVLIPILIRIGEFAEWRDQDKTKTLIDYIGEHTWFSERYCDEDGCGSALKELIYHGHVLILLDGLDEISEIGRRSEIIVVVREFVEEYMRAPDFVSAFDDKMFVNTDLVYFGEVIEIQQPNRLDGDGNQIVITSRIAGYQLYPLEGTFIQHYSLSLMDHSEAKGFVEEWITQVEKGVQKVLESNGIELDREIIGTLSNIRYTAVKAMFESDSKLLLSNPSLLSLICKFIFQLHNEFRPKSRVEVYYHAVQSALYTMTSQEACMSESVLTHFLIDLAIYLHLHSQSGLIDEYDMKRLCRLTLKQIKLSNNRKQLSIYVEKLISLLESNAGIAVERGLQTYGFQHLSFQEYFVALGLVKGHSIDEIAKRILSLTINARFRESLRLALGWISWKRSFDDYNELCNLLITSSKENVIPFGILLFFDAFDDLQILPSNSIIFMAFNILLDHPFDVVKHTYLILSLVKLHDDIIAEWIQSHLTDEKHLVKFCQCLLNQSIKCDNDIHSIRWKRLYVVYRQLWLLPNLSTSAEFVIDHTLRDAVLLGNISEPIFNKDLLPYLTLNNICAPDIHPLIMSVVIAICGGVHFEIEKMKIKIDFSLEKMHRESSVIPQLIDYFINHKETHSIKVQTLIKHYESILEKSLPHDTSIAIIDTFIALICLRGVLQPSIYEKYNKYLALPLALERFKRIGFYFKESIDTCKSYVGSKMSFNSFEIQPTIDVFFSQSNKFDEQCILFSLACASACKRFDNLDVRNLFDINISLETLINSDVQDQLKFIYYISEGTFEQIVKNIDSPQMFQQNPFLLLTLLPKSLQQLYYYTNIATIQNINSSLPLVVLLLQCLTHIEDILSSNFNICLILSMLQPLLKETMLENYATMLFRKHCNNPLIVVEDWKILIDEECQRITKVKDAIQNQEKDLQLFAASISLARIFQAQYRQCKYLKIKQINLPTVESKKVYDAIRTILDPVLRIISLNIILELKDPNIFDEEQRDKIRYEMIILLEYLLPHFSLLTSTLLLIQCHTACQLFPERLHHMASIIGNKLNQSSIDKESQEAAYIALRQLNNPDLSQHLSRFAKRTTNLSDLLHFNSTIFHRWFSNTTSFDSLNTTFLSFMYLTELAFDVQSLKMYTKDDHTNKISSIKELERLWKNASTNKEIMTYQIATWITNYLPMVNKGDLDQMIIDLRRCLIIEKKALTVIEQWLNYRTVEFLNIFVDYAALQLVIHGSTKSDLITIIEEIFSVDNKLDMIPVVERLFNSQFVDINTLRPILITLHRSICYSSNIYFLIDREDILKLILDLEFERIINSNENKLSTNSSRPFLLMIKDCSKDLQLYLKEHLCTILSEQSEDKITSKETYAAIVIKWITERLIWRESRENYSVELYEYIFMLLDDERFPQVQKAIVNGLNSMLINQSSIFKTNISIQKDVIAKLESMICLWNSYSDDVMAICLLAYGNCLLSLQEYQISHSVSSETKNILNINSLKPSSEIISARATLCLIFSENRNIKFSTILHEFRNKSNVTPEKRYNILLQQTLYNVSHSSYGMNANENEAVDHLGADSVQMIERLAIDLYSYMYNGDKTNYLSDPIPNYIKMAQKLSKNKLTEFRNAIKKTFSNEKEFKSKLSFYCEKRPNDRKASIELYTAFGELTVELLEMLQDADEDTLETFFSYRITVYDRVVIENLFQHLYSTKSKIKFKNDLILLKYLTEIHAVSFSEVHQKVSIVKNLPYNYDDESWYNRELEISLFLLSLSCFETEFSHDIRKNIYVKSDIEEAFEKKIGDFNKNSGFFSETK